jgi:hypothetical protein
MDVVAVDRLTNRYLVVGASHEIGAELRAVGWSTEFTLGVVLVKPRWYGTRGVMVVP